MSGTFPQTKPDWSNVEVIHRNTLPPRSYFFLYDNEADALRENVEKACATKLSGTWKFHHSNSPFEAPTGFEANNYNVMRWSDIRVPGIWQLQGWGKPHYTNVNYPIFVDPPNVPFNDNQTGCYVRTFTIPQRFANSQHRLRFEGVDSAFHVWINGKEVGYSQGSRNASEFDVTSCVSEQAENKIAVKVYQYCDGSYIEDQDQWRFSGIFRDVYLHSFPKAHINDIYIEPLLDDKYETASLKVNIDVAGEGEVRIKLLDRDGQQVAATSESGPNEQGKVQFDLKDFKDILKWTAETPNLYKLVLSYNSRFIVQNVGFRRVEIKDGIYMVNGKRIVFRGANRHEHHPIHGRAVPYDFMKQDLLLMKTHNINAIRTCHQPSDPRLYALADELGFWVMDEADMECHGFASIDAMALPMEKRMASFEEKKALVYGGAARFTSDKPEWKNQYVDRARQLVMRDKNHPCVVMWSLGNEAFYGCNFQSMYDEIKQIERSRPVHYEGDSEAQTVDLYSQMYPSVEDIIKFAQLPDYNKPLVLCEFVHAMGNGPGNIKEYIDAFYQYPRLQGGWVWEWANHGLKDKNEGGDEYYAYGGDYGDEPNDYNFILDGVLFSDHTPNPGLIEYRKAIEPVQVSNLTDKTFTITNRYDVIDLSHLRCEATLITDGTRQELGELPVPEHLLPHTSTEQSLPEAVDVSPTQGERYLQIDFRLKEATKWAPAGHLISSSQLQLQTPEPLSIRPSSSTAPTLSQSTPSSLQIEAEDTQITISLVSGKIVSYVKAGTELIHDHLGPELTIYRALTDNDRPQDGHEWREALVHLGKTHVYSVNWSTDTSASSVSVEVVAKVAPPVFNWCLETTSTYTIFSNGTVQIECRGSPKGLNVPSTLPRLGLEFAMPASFDNVSWFGRGPGESYKDKKLSQHFGNWSKKVDDLWVDYEFPQEGGNRTDVRWVRFGANDATSSALESVRASTEKLPIVEDLVSGQASIAAAGKKPSLTARFGQQEGFSFNASHYTTKDVNESKHPYELYKKKKDYVIVRLDADHHGLGTGSCGPKTLEKYALKTGDFSFEIVLE